MTDTNRISIETLDETMKNTYSPTITTAWNGIEITIKKTLSFTEMLRFVNDAANSCFVGDEAKYMPELKDFAIKSNILEMYANFTLPENLEHRYELIYCTDAVDTIINHINTKQLGEIVDAIEKRIRNAEQANIDSVNKQINDVCSSLLQLKESLESAFNGIDAEDLAKLISAIVNNQFDEEKLVRSYIEHTTNERNPIGSEQ